MPLIYDAVIGREFPPVTQTYTSRDVILYALGIGHGQDPMDLADLPYVYERLLRPATTFPLVLGFTSLREVDLGVDYARVVHSDQSLVVHAPLPVEGTIVAHTRVSAIHDRGPDRGALLVLERRICDQASGVPLATSTMGALCRGDGGCGGPGMTWVRPPDMPDRPPDFASDFRSQPNAALLYRLSGDLNPLHIDPAAATKAGFERPLLHGLATFGAAVREAVRHCLDGRACRIASVAARFTAPVFPGETIRMRFWQVDDELHFTGGIVERGLVALSSGRITLHAMDGPGMGFGVETGRDTPRAPAGPRR